jgi:hypothetical protein
MESTPISITGNAEQKLQEDERNLRDHRCLFANHLCPGAWRISGPLGAAAKNLGFPDKRLSRQ